MNPTAAEKITRSRACDRFLYNRKIVQSSLVGIIACVYLCGLQSVYIYHRLSVGLMIVYVLDTFAIPSATIISMWIVCIMTQGYLFSFALDFLRENSESPTFGAGSFVWAAAVSTLPLFCAVWGTLQFKWTYRDFSQLASSMERFLFVGVSIPSTCCVGGIAFAHTLRSCRDYGYDESLFYFLPPCSLFFAHTLQYAVLYGEPLAISATRSLTRLSPPRLREDRAEAKPRRYQVSTASVAPAKTITSGGLVCGESHARIHALLCLFGPSTTIFVVQTYQRIETNIFISRLFLACAVPPLLFCVLSKRFGRRTGGEKSWWWWISARFRRELSDYLRSNSFGSRCLAFAGIFSFLTALAMESTTSDNDNRTNMFVVFKCVLASILFVESACRSVSSVRNVVASLCSAAASVLFASVFLSAPFVLTVLASLVFCTHSYSTQRKRWKIIAIASVLTGSFARVVHVASTFADGASISICTDDSIGDASSIGTKTCIPVSFILWITFCAFVLSVLIISLDTSKHTKSLHCSRRSWRKCRSILLILQGACALVVSSTLSLGHVTVDRSTSFEANEIVCILRVVVSSYLVVSNGTILVILLLRQRARVAHLLDDALFGMYSALILSVVEANSRTCSTTMLANLAMFLSVFFLAIAILRLVRILRDDHGENRRENLISFRNNKTRQSVCERMTSALGLSSSDRLFVRRLCIAVVAVFFSVDTHLRRSCLSPLASSSHATATDDDMVARWTFASEILLVCTAAFVRYRRIRPKIFAFGCFVVVSAHFGLLPTFHPGEISKSFATSFRRNMDEYEYDNGADSAGCSPLWGQWVIWIVLLALIFDLWRLRLPSTSLALALGAFAGSALCIHCVSSNVPLILTFAALYGSCFATAVSIARASAPPNPGRQIGSRRIAVLFLLFASTLAGACILEASFENVFSVQGHGALLCFLLAATGTAPTTRTRKLRRTLGRFVADAKSSFSHSRYRTRLKYIFILSAFVSHWIRGICDGSGSPEIVSWIRSGAAILSWMLGFSYATHRYQLSYGVSSMISAVPLVLVSVRVGRFRTRHVVALMIATALACDAVRSFVDVSHFGKHVSESVTSSVRSAVLGPDRFVRMLSWACTILAYGLSIRAVAMGTHKDSLTLPLLLHGIALVSLAEISMNRFALFGIAIVALELLRVHSSLRRSARTI